MDTTGFITGYLQKEAGPISDELVRVPIDILTGPVAAPAFIGGIMHGATEADLREMNLGSSKAAIPLVGAFRSGRRLAATYRRSKELSGEKSKALRNILSEYLGGLGGAATWGGAGAAIGAGLGVHPSIDMKQGAKIGGAAGLGAYGVLAVYGAVQAAKKRRRDKLEQAKYDAESHVLENVFNPAETAYNFLKRKGSTGMDPLRSKQLLGAY